MLFLIFLATIAVAFSPASFPSRNYPRSKSVSLALVKPYGKKTPPSNDSDFDHVENSKKDDVIDNEGESQHDGSSDVTEAEANPKKTEPISDPMSEPASPIDEALTTLLKIAASTGRGEFAKAEQKHEAESLISFLEAQNPTEEPVRSPLAIGRWELLYSSTRFFRSSPFFMAGRAVCWNPEHAQKFDWFCDMHRMALAISSIGQVLQIISPTRMTSEIEVHMGVRIGVVPFLTDFNQLRYPGRWPSTMKGVIISSAAIVPNVSGDTWELDMDTVDIKGYNIPDFDPPIGQGIKRGNVSSYTNPKPVFKTAYLSENHLISREQDGKVFVYRKVSSDPTPSNYFILTTC